VRPYLLWYAAYLMGYGLGGGAMAMTRVGQIDLDTGEILEATLALHYPKRRNGFVTGWVAMAQEPMMKLAQADLGDQARRVLFALLAKLDFENYLAVNAAELGRALGMARPHVSRAIARLMVEGVLLQGPRVQNRGTYTLNPRYGWKGSARGHQEALQARMRAAGLSVVDGGPPEAVDDRTGDLFGPA
jgi:hypothetical protein